MSVATFDRFGGCIARTAGWLTEPAARAHWWCVLTSTSRFMNAFVKKDVRMTP
jgi:hypothetical protein